MKKRLCIILITALVLCFGSTGYAFAATDTDYENSLKVYSMVEKTNLEIDKEIQEAIQKGGKMLFEIKKDLVKIERDATKLDDNERAEKNQKLLEKFDKDLNKLIDDLITKTNGKANDLVEKAFKKGILVENGFIEVTVGNRTILVDPCKVRGN